VDDVHVEPAGACFGDSTPQNVVLARAPDIDLDAVAAFELGDEADEVFLRQGGIQRQRAFAFGIGDQACRTVDALV
jgi:hypothetical protein